MLTNAQAELLSFIADRIVDTGGVPPSFDEMKHALGLRSKSGIHRLIVALEERGYIARLPNRARAIKVIQLPKPGAGKDGFVSQEYLAGYRDGRLAGLKEAGRVVPFLSRSITNGVASS